MENKTSLEPVFPGGTVTFLFTDIEGSTRLIKQLGEDYVKLLADHHRMLRAAFTLHNGHEVDTEGDAFFVSFPRATDAMAAVAEAQRAIAQHDWPGNAQVRVRMGLHTGEPWTGGEGYVGMDVHRAARIAHTGHGGQVLLSETTTSLAKGNLPEGMSLVDLGHHRLKDMAFPEHIQQLVIEGLPADFPPLKSLGVVAPPQPPELEPPEPPPFLKEASGEPKRPVFVSRQRELTWLAERLDQAVDGQGQVLILTGEAGMGKASLLAAFARQAAELYPELLVTLGQCNAFSGQGDPYLPFREIFAQLCGDVEGPWRSGLLDSEAARRLWLALPQTAEIVSSEGDQLLGNFLPGKKLLGKLRSAAPKQHALHNQIQALMDRDTNTSTSGGQSRLFEQATAVLETLSSQYPLLIILDDMQWVDRGSVDLLFHLGRTLAGQRILVAAAYRPEEVATGRRGERHPLEAMLDEFKRLFGQQSLDLAQVEGRPFVDAFIDSEPNRLGEAFRKNLSHHTGGHALFTVELLRDMQERGDLIQDEDGYWQEGPDLNWSTLPARVEGVIEARIGRLEDELRDLLTIAAVEGEDFTAQVLARILEVQERKLLRTLSRELEQRHHLIVEKAALHNGQRLLARYRFAHTLFHRYLYNSISPVERRLLHREIADILQELYAGRTAEITVQLAWHYVEAGEDEKALPYLLKAGDSARDLYAFDEAVYYYERALEIYKNRADFEKASRILMKLGLTYHSAFDYERSNEAFEESFTFQRQSTVWSPPAILSQAQHPFRMASADVLTFDPGKHNDSNTSSILDQLFRGLIALTPDMNVVPDIARSWEVLDDGKIYIFHLRQDVRWSDGEPVTAHDFVLSWSRALDPESGSPAAPLLYDVHGASSLHLGEESAQKELGVEALDDWTLQIELEQPCSYFLYLLNHDVTKPVPSHIVASHGDNWADPDNLVFNGPFGIESFEKNHSLILRRNPTYHGDYRGNLETIEIRSMTSPAYDPEILMAEYEQDHLDLFNLIWLTPVEMQRMVQSYASDYMTAANPMVVYVAFNVTEPPFDDARVRRAFVLSTDRPGLISINEIGYISVATGGFTPVGMPGHFPGLALPYDVKEAQRLLAEAGYPGGAGFPRVSVLLWDFASRFADSLIKFWQTRLGVNVSIEIVDWSTFTERLSHERERHHIHTHAWGADYPDPDSFLRVGIENSSKWKNETYSTLVNRARRVMDHEKRMRLYRQAEEILVREAPVFPIFYYRWHLLVKPWVRNYRHGGIGTQLWKDVIIDPH